jgi:Na+/H+ antiporter NhaD/arsenite permease-like protein
MPSLIPLIILAVIFILIIIRQVGRFKLKIWQIMLGGAIAMLLTLQISPIASISYINFDVIFFLIGIFIIGQTLEESGYLSHIEYALFSRAKNVNWLVLAILFGFGLLSMLLMNDTMAIIGTPIVILLSKKHGINTKMLMLALAFGITIGSVASPIGNPQNLLIASSGSIKDPFILFLEYLFIPTLINLFIAYILLKIFYKNEFNKNLAIYEKEKLKDKNLAGLAKVSLVLLMLFIILQISAYVLDFQMPFPLYYIAIASALPILLFSNKRFSIVKHIDWYTIIFFISLFIVMGGVWQSGFFQQLMEGSSTPVTSLLAIMPISIIVSQFISNVPLVILYLKILGISAVPTISLLALAAGSTIAGNLTILGAASNVIIIQNAEKRHNETLSFIDFAKIGIPLTIINSIIYLIFFRI